jgi:uncharacterized membrane protein YhaH (DUF805 family)
VPVFDVSPKDVSAFMYSISVSSFRGWSMVPLLTHSKLFKYISMRKLTAIDNLTIVVILGSVIYYLARKDDFMRFFATIKNCFVEYANFSDRASRSEFWLFSLFILIVSVILNIIDARIAGVPFLVYDNPFASLGTIFSLAIIVPSFSVTARRFHDINRSGWWMLLSLTIIGIIPLIYWSYKKGDEGENQFGFRPMV